MKGTFTIAFSLIIAGLSAQTQINTTGSFTFSPDEVTIMLGESVVFDLGAIHTATQISEEDWNNNVADPLPGGFNFGGGVHPYTPAEAGTIYYICDPHSSMGMKGKIIVETDSGLEEKGNAMLRVFPNPASDELVVESTGTGHVLILVDIQGREVLRHTVSSTARVDITGLKEGNYTALVRDANGEQILSERIAIAR